MKYLFKIYRTRLLGFLLLIAGLSLVFTTLVFFFPNNKMEYIEILIQSLKYISIMVFGFLTTIIGIGIAVKDDDAKNLIKNFNDAFKIEK